VLLALPAGAWADLVDRRRLLLAAQAAMFLAAAVLAATTFLGATSPALILGLTFALGCGNAVASPAWQAIQPDLVDRRLLPQAAALNGLNMNVARAVGPAVGGFVVAGIGAGWVFALNAVSFVGIAATVARWRPPERADSGPRERLAEALVAGGRYVRHALRWELFRDGSDPTKFVESYVVGTWAEHLRQHEDRLTGADRRFEEQARRYARGEPQIAHLFPPSSGPS
jgi:MFS family permease